MEHIRAQGEITLRHFQEAAPVGPQGVMLKVVSDIDDTLMSSGGHFPAGVDTRFPKYAPHPTGCLHLCRVSHC